MEPRKELQKILYVEDDPGIQGIAQIALQELGGLDLNVCSSGAEAIQAVAQYCPDLLLLDVMMPQMDGPTTLQKLQQLESAKNIPAIFMTAKVQEHEVTALKQLHNTIGVIAKPFDPITLADQVRKMWESC